MEKEENNDGFKKFYLICMVIGFSLFFFAGYIFVFGLPNLTSNFKEEGTFCMENNGTPIEPSSETYNQMLCIFDYNGTSVSYAASKITNKDWADTMGKKVGEYCFNCWSEVDCNSPHNDILRVKGVHC